MTPTEEHRDEGEAMAAEAGARPRRRPRSAPPQLDFPLVRNGLDYLESVVEHLDENESAVTPRDVKYAVLHLQAAVEVLLKARLMAEHWSLVFIDPGKATREALDEATLSSVSTDQAVTRLQNIAGVPITEKEAKTLAELGKYRNKLQHFGMTAAARAVEAKAGEVLDFLIRFVDAQLTPRLSPEERAETEGELDRLRGGLARISTFVRESTNRIRGEVRREGAENRTIQCPECEQMALVLGGTTGPDGEPEGATCRFCTTRWELEDLLACFPADGQDEPSQLNTCPQCEEWVLGWGVRVLSDSEVDVPFCFSCSAALPSVLPCARCTRPVDTAGSGSQLCGSCWEEAMEEDRYGREIPSDYGYVAGQWGADRVEDGQEQR